MKPKNQKSPQMFSHSLQTPGPACHVEAHHCLEFPQPPGDSIVMAIEPDRQAEPEAGATYADL